MRIRTEGYAAITKYLDSTLGLKDAFFNSWSSSTAQADELGLAGSVTVLVLTNNATATVESLAEINQNRRLAQLRLTPNNRDARRRNRRRPRRSRGRAGRLDRGDELPAVHQHGRDLRAARPRPRRRRARSSRSGCRSARSARPARRAASAAPFYISVQDNTTHAIVEDGAKVYSGFDGGFNMKAEEAMFHIDLVQSGASGGKFAIAGSVAYVGQDSDTLVQLGATARVTGRDARLYAGDLTTQVTWVGGIAKGEGLGVGISVAINDLDRTTRRSSAIPRRSTSSGTAATSSPSITVTGVVDVLAKLDGDLWAFSVAGAFSAPGPPEPQPPADARPKALAVLGSARVDPADRHRDRGGRLDQPRARHDAGLDRRCRQDLRRRRQRHRAGRLLPALGDRRRGVRRGHAAGLGVARRRVQRQRPRGDDAGVRRRHRHRRDRQAVRRRDAQRRPRHDRRRPRRRRRQRQHQRRRIVRAQPHLQRDRGLPRTGRRRTSPATSRCRHPTARGSSPSAAGSRSAARPGVGSASG